MLIFLPSLSNSLKTLTNSSDVSFVSPLNSRIQPLAPAMVLARKIKITFALNEDRPLLVLSEFNACALRVLGPPADNIQIYVWTCKTGVMSEANKSLEGRRIKQNYKAFPRTRLT